MIDLDIEAQEVGRLATRLANFKEALITEQALLKAATKQVARTQEASELLQLIAQAVQQKAHERISKVVSSCLSTVFDDPYEFVIRFERKRGKTEANLRFLRRGLDVDPMTASGGGMVDVAAFALRAACIMLHRPRLSKVLVLDEPFKFVSAKYRDNVRTMLEQLSKDLGMQIVMVTHVEELETGKVVDL